MTLDSQLHQRLASAVDDTAVPSGLAHAAVTGGRRRRARRRAGAMVLASAVIVGGALLLPQQAPTTAETPVAADKAHFAMPGLAWARSLPEGAAAEVPFFGEGGLWSEGQRVSVPAAVNTAVAPRQVSGGWLVSLNGAADTMVWAVLSPDGSLSELPAVPSADAVGDAGLVVSADGDRIAYADRVVDLDTMAVTELPHTPQGQEVSGDRNAIQMIGFSDQGLLYEGAPFTHGTGTTWLWEADGTTTEVRPPVDSHVMPPGALALKIDGPDTCTTAYALQAGAWVEAGSGCMGRELGMPIAISPEHRWLVTDDLPEVWDLQDGAWRSVEMPRDVARAQVEAQHGGVAWENDDSFLLPVADRWVGPSLPEPPFDQRVQIVRCLMSTGLCERAGAEQSVQVNELKGAITQMRFARDAF